MFTRQDFERSYDHFIGEDTLPLRVHQFDGEADFTFDPEQRIDVISGSKQTFATALQFWMRCMRFVFYRDWNYGIQLSSNPAAQRHDPEDYLRQIARDPRNNICRPLSQQEFVSVVDDCTALLRQPYRLTLRGRFIAAMMMCDEWNDKEVLCETTEEYLAFRWNTSA